MERPDQERVQRNAVDILLSIGQRLEREGDLHGAINSYQLALAHLSQDDPRRADVQSRITELERRAGGEQLPDVPFVARPGPQTSPEPMPPRPAVSRPAPPLHRDPATSRSRQRVQTAAAAQADRYQRVINPAWSWLLVGCAILLGLALPVILVLFFSQFGFPALPGIGARTIGQTAATPTSHITPTAPRAPAAAPPSSATVKPASGAGSSTSAKQAIVIFEDNFGRPTLDGSKWILDNTQNTTIDLSHGTLRLSSSGSHFPYVHSRVNPFPATGDLKATVRFQYLGAGTCGVPLAMASFVLPAGFSRNETDRLSSDAERTGISIWFWRNVAYYRAGSVREDISLNPLTGWHVATVDYIGGVYHLSIDATPIYASVQTNVRPAVVWFGLPFDLGSGNNCTWDTLEISEVRVEALR